MFWRAKPKPGPKTRRQSGRRLRVEPLESRQMLDGNVISALAAGTLTLTGNVDANQVEIWQGPNAGQFFVRGQVGSNTNIDGGSVIREFNGVTNITVRLAEGGDTFDFLPKGTASVPGTGPAQSILGGTLDIENNSGADTNSLTSVQLNALTLRRAGSAGNSNLSILNSRVLGLTDVNHTLPGGFGGGSNTRIQNSNLDGGLVITNGTGDDIVTVQGCKIVGDTTVTNADGRSRVIFTLWNGSSPINLGGETILVGNLTINTNTTDPAFLDTASLTGTKVQGTVAINNPGSARTQTIIGQDPQDITPPVNTTPSSLGTDVVTAGPITVTNGTGYDSFLMLQSTAQWGLTINNGAAGFLGSDTVITDSRISDFPIAVVGLNITGDAGNDNVTITSTTVGQTTTINLNNGVNTVNLAKGASGLASQFDTLVINGGNDKDLVNIKQTSVRVRTAITLLGGIDDVWIDAEPGQAAPPTFSQFVGPLVIDGGNPPGTPDPDTLRLNTNVNLVLANLLPTNIFTVLV